MDHNEGQLRLMVATGEDLFNYPDLFLFVLTYALQPITSHFVEGSHRQISLHSSGAVMNMLPGGHSVAMRTDEASAVIDCPRGMAWLCWAWNSNKTLLDVLSPFHTADELKQLLYFERVNKI